MSSFTDKFLCIWHGTALCSTLFFLYCGMFGDGFEIDFLFHLTFLTQETVAVYYLWAFTQDIRNLISGTSKKHRYENGTYTYLQLLVPLTGLVTVGYWAVRLRDVNLMLTPEAQNDPIIIGVYNHGIGASLCLIELIGFEQRHLKNFRWKLKTLVAGFSIYLLTQFLFHFNTGRHVYPFLKAFTLSQIIGFYSGLTIFVIAMERLTSLLLGPLVEEAIECAEEVDDSKPLGKEISYQKAKVA